VIYPEAVCEVTGYVPPLAAVPKVAGTTAAAAAGTTAAAAAGSAKKPA
jgi:hypothetical protein